MFIRKILNWTKSSINDDKLELNAYQKFQDQFNAIDNKALEYIKEEGFNDPRTFIDYEGQQVPLSYLEILAQTTMKDKNLSAEERAYKAASLRNFYQKKSEELKDRVIAFSLINPNSPALAYIRSSILILNSLLREYANLLAINRSGIYEINNTNSNAGLKLRILKDNIDIRITEIENRLLLEEKRNYR